MHLVVIVICRGLLRAGFYFFCFDVLSYSTLLVFVDIFLIFIFLFPVYREEQERREKH